MVRIEPRSPQLPVNFREWDGLVRLCFGRKNKTLGAIFRQGSTLAHLEANQRLHQALAGTTGQAGPSDLASMMDTDVAMDAADNEGLLPDEEMDVDNGSVLGDQHRKVTRRKDTKCCPAFKEKILALLQNNGFEDLRSAKLSQDDFLRLLSIFNCAGIHFA